MSTTEEKEKQLKKDIDDLEKLAGNLMSTFVWDNTIQGHSYWQDVHVGLFKLAKLKRKELLKLKRRK